MLDFQLISVITVCALILVAAAVFVFKKMGRARELLSQAHQAKEQIKKELESERREALIKLKDEMHKRRSEADTEIKKNVTILNGFSLN